jgi:hypothetical protein
VQAGWLATLVAAAIIVPTVVRYFRRELAAGALLAVAHARTIDGRVIHENRCPQRPLVQPSCPRHRR